MIRQIGHAVLVQTDIEAQIPTPLILVDDVGIDAELDTAVANPTYILHSLIETRRRSKRLIQQQLIVIGLIQIEGHLYAFDERQVNTHGCHVGCLPMQVVIGRTTRATGYLVLVELIQGVCTQILECRNIVVTGQAVRCTQLEEAYYILTLHELLVADQPAGCYGGEVTNAGLARKE